MNSNHNNSLTVSAASGARRHWIALALTAPAAAAALALQAEVPFRAMLFEGGARVFVGNLSEAVLFPYVAVIMLALGTLFLPRPVRADDNRVAELDVQLVRFFSGAALLVLLGFGLGLARLLYPWVTIPIFCGILYVYFLWNPDFVRHAVAWIFARDESIAHADGRDPFAQDVSALLRLAMLLVVLFLLLVKGIFLQLFISDDIQLYYPYLAEIRLQHGIWLDPAHPVYSSFLIGRGNGAHLFFASFTNQFFGQVLSIVYLVAIALVMHRAVSLMVPADSDSALWRTAREILPDCAMLLALVSPILSIDVAKYHLQTSAFVTFLSWSSLLFLLTGPAQARWLFRMLLPVAIAIPIMLPQYQAMATVSLAIAAIAVHLVRGKAAARHCLILLGAGLLAMSGSLLFNQFYIGVAELNPASLFLKFGTPERLRQWTSPELFQYLNLTQDVSGFFALWSGRYAPSTARLVIVELLDIVSFTYFIFFAIRRIDDGIRSGGFLDRMPPPVSVFLGAFIFNYLVWTTVSGVTNHPSAVRLLQYVGAYAPTVKIAVAIFIAALLLPGSKAATASGNTPTPRSTLSLVLVSLACSLVAVQTVIFGFGNSFLYGYRISLGLVILAIAMPVIAHRLRPWQESPIIASLLAMISRFLASRAGLSILVLLFAVATLKDGLGDLREYEASVSQSLGSPLGMGAASYFAGKEGLSASISKGDFNFKRCLEIGEAVPGDAKVLPLNANYNIVPCQNSPLLPRNKIVHHYESVLAPYFVDVAYGGEERAAEIMRKLGINFFYVQKSDTDFFGPGFGELFSWDNLVRRFDVYRETGDFLILTWRGQGTAPVSPETASAIEWLREEGCDHPPHDPLIDNCAAYYKLKKRLGQQGVK
ncbi:MAG: hypothetical protein WA373_14955 [Burkholderiales bacterium]